MRVSLSWLRDHVELPADVPAREVADRFVRAGLEVESVDDLAAAVSGPLVTARVLTFENEPQKNGKTIRWCSVDTGEGEPRGIVCGAANFAVDDVVVVALPSAVLLGGFAISARTTYGHVSDGMICSVRELGIGDEHDGILVLPAGTPVGVDARGVLGMDDAVLDVAPTPDRGYALSARGLAREAATAFDVPFHDPVEYGAPAATDPPAWPVVVDDPAGCDVFAVLRVDGFDPTAPTPPWLARRLVQGGMRSISLAVDVTNFVMLDLGQPLHAYDADTLSGPIVVRRATAGEKLTTLDGAVRELDAGDLLITDDSGPIGIAGVMGGAHTEISASTTDIVLEAAHFDPATVSRSGRRHRLPSEASRRFERGVDPALAHPAGLRAARLLAELGGGRVVDALTVVGDPAPPTAISMTLDHPTRVAGRPVATDAVVRRLEQVGCRVAADGDDVISVLPPSWRPDLRDPADLAEEVLRLEGYETLPSRLPQAPAGRGLTPPQRLRRRVGRSLAAAGYVEAPSYPFVADQVWDDLGLPADDARRHALRLVNPLSDAEPLLRTTLLPGLLAALRRNVRRGTPDVALFEQGVVFRPRPNQPLSAPVLGTTRRPEPAELAAQDEALPDQPQRVGVVMAGEFSPSGWWGVGRPAGWADAVEAARSIGREAGVALEVAADDHAPWHPGRCAVLSTGERIVGHAGELHPRVVSAWDLPPRTCAMELDLDLLGIGGLVVAPAVSTFPLATQDVALVVGSRVASADVAAALRAGAGPLLEDLRLFDLYSGSQVADGRRSLAYTLRFRAPDRTLTTEEVSAARESAVAEATRRTGAVLRGA